MKQICYDMIGAYYYSKALGIKEEHPLLAMKNFGLDIVVAVPESIGDCWVCVVEDFNFELPDHIHIRDDISWDYFYGHFPKLSVEAMKKCGVDYEAVIHKVEADEKRWAEQRVANKKFVISDIKDVKAFDTSGSCVFTMSLSN